MPEYDHWARFDLSSNLLFETEYWLVALRQKQITLGSCLILLKRATGSLADLTAAEAADLPAAVGEFEGRASSAFGAERFNYLAAMMKDPYVHFHAFPRYSGEREFGGSVWHDEVWPKAIELRDVSVDPDVLEQVRSGLRSASR